MEDDANGPAVRFPPPLVFFILMLVGYGAQRYGPIGIGVSPELKYLGAAVAIAGLCIVGLTRQQFKRAETNIEPWKSTTKILSTGIYAHSRNPVYVAFCLLPIGWGLFLDSLWILLSFVPSVALVYWTAIRKEEAYLEKKFGEEYVQYKRRVRRWL